MQTDKNTIIGFVLLGILFFLFFWFTSKQQSAVMDQQKHQADSIAKINASKIKSTDTIIAKTDSLRNDSLAKKTAAGDFQSAANGTEQLTVVENNLMKATFTNKGGQLKSVELKNYKFPFNGKNVVLSGGEQDEIGYAINTGNNQSALTSSLYFNVTQIVKNADKSTTVTFTLSSNNGQSITHQYIIKPDNYMINWNIILNGADKLLTQNTLNFQWQQHPKQHESSVSYERAMSNICFYEGNDFDYISSKTDHKFESPVKWVSIVPQFFNMTLVAKNNFTSGNVQWARRTDSSNILSDVNIALQTKVPSSSSIIVPMQLFFGPNEYHVLQNQASAPDMDKIVNLGRDLYSFVRPINKYIIMPVYNFFVSLIKNYGWAILLLTLFIRLVTSPLVYTSYLSGAKMRVMRPELDILKKKFGDDKQGYAVEQMKVFREAGINPLGGCIPALLQIPIFFALYSFFNSNISLRGQPFLWSPDLSAYDPFIQFHSDIWLIGDHISLFTVTAIITSFLISMYNMSMTPDQSNPAMKYMPYIFPFVLFFVFNKLPSALTWYYTVSNLVTLGLQFVIQNYIINHDKILAQIDLKRKTPKTKSKFQERYQQMMEAQKKMQQLKQKNQGRKL
ncbi:MAG: membrane protein insertase YidC [Chitinophagaceae bacterium]